MRWGPGGAPRTSFGTAVQQLNSGKWPHFLLEWPSLSMPTQFPVAAALRSQPDAPLGSDSCGKSTCAMRASHALFRNPTKSTASALALVIAGADVFDSAGDWRSAFHEVLEQGHVGMMELVAKFSKCPAQGRGVGPAGRSGFGANSASGLPPGMPKGVPPDPRMVEGLAGTGKLRPVPQPTLRSEICDRGMPSRWHASIATVHWAIAPTVTRLLLLLNP